jgi:hypothetical protein
VASSGGFLAALFALLRFLIPLGGILGLVRVLVVSALMLAGFGGGGARGEGPIAGGPRRLNRDG